MIYNKKPNNFVPDIEVVGCLVIYKDKILLLNRHDNKSEGGKWGVPAGKKDQEDKDTISTILRELKEETGLLLKKEDLDFHKTFYVVYPDKKYFYHYYKTELKKETKIIIEKKEHKSFSWVSIQKALTLPLVMHEDHCLKNYYGIK